MQQSYLTPKAEVRVHATLGFDCVATEAIKLGDVVAAFGGRIADKAEIETKGFGGVQALQIDERLFLVTDDPADADFVNHSCDPNCTLRGTSMLVAARDIVPGEALRFDYATADGSDYDEFECSCGAGLCRGKVTGHDWMLPELQRRYAGAFSPYLAARIAELQGACSSSSVAQAPRRAFAY